MDKEKYLPYNGQAMGRVEKTGGDREWQYMKLEIISTTCALNAVIPKKSCASASVR